MKTSLIKLISVPLIFSVLILQTSCGIFATLPKSCQDAEAEIQSCFYVDVDVKLDGTVKCVLDSDPHNQKYWEYSTLEETIKKNGIIWKREHYALGKNCKKDVIDWAEKKCSKGK